MSAEGKWTAALKAKGHTPVLDEDGKIDWFVCDGGYHNGPGCSVCLKSWCEHCTQDPDTIGECEGAPEVTPDPRDALVADMAEALKEAEGALLQYRNDLRYPPKADSAERRTQMIDTALTRARAALAKGGAK